VSLLEHLFLPGKCFLGSFKHYYTMCKIEKTAADSLTLASQEIEKFCEETGSDITILQRSMKNSTKSISHVVSKQAIILRNTSK
jgi:hypothetical protein